MIQHVDMQALRQALRFGAMLAMAAASAPLGACSPSSTDSSDPGGVAACGPAIEDGAIHLAAGTTVPPGGDVTVCQRWTAPEDLDITGFTGTLGPGGHHALLLGQMGGDQPDGLAPCSEPEIMDAQRLGDFEVLAGVSYETDGQRFTFPSSPVQVGLRVPRGMQLILDAHFLNPGGTDIDGCATMDLWQDAPVVAALQFRTVLPEEEYALMIPAHGSIDVTYEEPTGGHFRVAAASSHMHVGGTYFRMSVVETDMTLYETTSWAEPKPAIYDNVKVVLEDGQTIRLECSFENVSSVDQRFPDQMCVGAMYLLPCSLPGAC